MDKTGRTDGTWSRADFEWHVENNQYICLNADTRKVTREEHENARQVARDIAKNKQYIISILLQKKKEMLFAHLKRILGLGRL